MVNMAPIDAAQVVVGVDTHKDEHVAVALASIGSASTSVSTDCQLRPQATRILNAGSPE